MGGVKATWIRPNGLKIEKVRVPLGVIAVLVEADPRTVVDAALLCIKAGNALVLAVDDAMAGTADRKSVV